MRHPASTDGLNLHSVTPVHTLGRKSHNLCSTGNIIRRWKLYLVFSQVEILQLQHLVILSVCNDLKGLKYKWVQLMNVVIRQTQVFHFFQSAVWRGADLWYRILFRDMSRCVRFIPANKPVLLKWTILFPDISKRRSPLLFRNVATCISLILLLCNSRDSNSLL